MTTALEDRLTAALHARAELVQPEDIEHPRLRPAAQKSPWRRPAVVGLAAAAAAAVAVGVIVVPLTSHDGSTVHQPLQINHHWPPSPDHPQPSQKLSDRLSGDVDGDGSPDQVRLSGSTLTVTLAADPGRPLSALVDHARGLAGLAGVGGAGRAVFVATDGLVQGHEWQAMAIRNGHLKFVPLQEGPTEGSISVVPGYRTSWLTPDGVAMTGTLDPVQNGERHLAVQVSRVEGRGDRSVITPVGRWCWDVVTQQTPAPCAPGVDNAYDPGPHGSLPALLPRVDINDSISPSQTWQGDGVSLRLEEDPEHARPELHQVYDVVGTIDGHDVSARAGVFNPLLYKAFLDLGHGVRGLAVTSGPEPTWHILALVDGHLVPVAAPRGTYRLHPGVQSVLYRGKGQFAQTWIGPDGRLFTSVQTGGVGQDELIQWQVADSSGTKLEPVDLGRMCMDEFWGTYGTCTSRQGG